MIPRRRGITGYNSMPEEILLISESVKEGEKNFDDARIEKI